MDPIRRIAAVVVFANVTFEVGGGSLLGLLTGGDGLTDFEEQFFRAGHGHAGVLLVLALAYLLLIERTVLSERARVGWTVTLLGGILAQSGGFFLHMVIGEEGSTSMGTYLTWLGAVVIAVALIAGGIGLWRRPQHLATTA